MFNLYLTPASISFLTQFILAAAISVFLISRLISFPIPQLALLTGFFTLATFFIGLMFLDVSLLPYPRLIYAVYAENAVLALALVFLIQFAYSFPQHYSRHKWESVVSLVISLAYFLWEAGIMVHRYIMLLDHGTVLYRPKYMSYFMAFVLILAPFAFIRQCCTSDTRPVGWLQKLRKPEGKNARGAQNFLCVFGIMFILGVTNVLLETGLPHKIYYVALSFGILIALWLFASTYINFIPQGVSVQFKFLVLTLTIYLALIGSVGRFIVPTYIETFQPNLKEHQTLRFTPNEAGSYDIAEVPFDYEYNLGERITLTHDYTFNSHKINFDFPFFGQKHSEVFISSFGMITMDDALWEPNLQARSAGFPAIFPLVIDLNPESKVDGDSGMYFRVDNDAGRLVLTWNRLSTYYYPDAVFTFQTVLYEDGVFDINYKDLPLPIHFNPDDSPRAGPWLRGAVSGQGELLHTGTADLVLTSQKEGYPLVENYHQAFREYLHRFMTPLVGIVLGGSILLMIGLPLLLRFSIIEPLKTLTGGVKRMEAGELTVELPIQNEDEIGFLTNAFNTMAARLNVFITDLEKLVTDRTSELVVANKSLQKQLSENEAMRAELREQAIRDPLTNAYNRRFLIEILDGEISRSKRYEEPFSLVMMDVDHFKILNDNFGHQAGDSVLKQLVSLLKETTRKSDVICRCGGEEFVVLMPNTTQKDAFQRAEAWRLACEKINFKFEQKTIRITLSMGIVAYEDFDLSGKQLLKMADLAMYRAKAAGRNCTRVFQED